MKLNGFRLGVLVLVSVSIFTLVVAERAARAPARGSESTSRADEVIRRTFTRNDQLLIARAFAEGDANIQILLAADPAQTVTLAKILRDRGFDVRYISSDLGYIRVRVPLRDVDDVAAMPQIQRINVDAATQFDVALTGLTVRGDSTVVRPRSPDPWPTPNASTGHANAFTGVRELRAAEFKRAHPTFDGRGVRLAFFESADPTSPFLQHARALDGNIIPKIVDMIYAIRPAGLSEQTTTSARESSGWVPMRVQVTTVHHHFSFNGRTFTAPYDGTFRFGMFALRKDIQFVNVLHPHGTIYADRLHFPVLWDVGRGIVWVNSKQDGNFANEHPLMDFKLRHDIGYLKLRSDWGWYTVQFQPGQPVPVNYPYTVETDPADKYVALHLSFGSTHGTGASSVSIGQGYFGGAFDGVAPGAQMVSIDTAIAPYSDQFEALIEGARYPKVNVISLSWGACFSNEDGASVMDIIVNRIVQRYGVLAFVSAANNGPAMSTVCSPSIADNAISVGAYKSKEMYGANNGVAVPNEDYLAYFSSRGPRRDGGFKPDVVAPTEILSAEPLVSPRVAMQGGRLLLPPGYGIMGGTSGAAPVAAGAGALLVSAAMQMGIPHDPLRLKRALVASARQLTGYGAAEQGGGLIDVVSAWNELKKMAASEPIVIRATAPVKDISSQDLIVPNQGEGLFEREGWRAGMEADRIYTFTRTNGSDEDMTFDVRWIHDDGTFTSTSSITLPRERATPFAVHVRAKTSGLHSAILQLVDPQTGLVADERMNTIVAAEQFRPGNRFTIVHSSAIAYPGITHYFFNVPKGTGLFSVQMRVAKRDVPAFSSPGPDLTTSALRYVFFTVHDPSGQLSLPYATPSVNAGGLWSQAFSHPVPGVWEVVIDNRPFGQFASKPKSLGAAPFTLTARTMSLSSVGTAVVEPSMITYTIQSHMAPVRLKVLDAPLGRLRGMRLTLTPAEPRKVIPIDVPAAATQVQATIADLGNKQSDVDVYLFNCAKNNLGKSDPYRYQGACEFKVSANARDGGIARYDGTDLPAGRWVAVVDARRIDGTSANIQYSDVVVDAAYGTSRIMTARPFLPAGVATAVTVRVVRGRPVPRGTALVAVPLLEAQDGMFTYTTATTWAAYTLKNPPIFRTWPTLWETITPL